MRVCWRRKRKKCSFKPIKPAPKDQGTTVSASLCECFHGKRPRKSPVLNMKRLTGVKCRLTSRNASGRMFCGQIKQNYSLLASHNSCMFFQRKGRHPRSEKDSVVLSCCFVAAVTAWLRPVQDTMKSSQTYSQRALRLQVGRPPTGESLKTYILKCIKTVLKSDPDLNPCYGYSWKSQIRH